MKAEQIREFKNYELWWKYILFWRSHLDIFLMQVMKVNLKDTQQIIARACGNATNIKITQSRGYGKSWLTAWIVIAIAILYPNTPIAVVSATASQANIVLRKIRSFVDTYPELLPQIKMVGREPVVINSEKGYVYFKNGSKIESYTLTRIVGERAKVLVIDEAPKASEQDIKKGASPITNYTRDICLQYGYEDFDSKIISITSACLKSNYFFKDFEDTYNQMRAGNKKAFACALDYRSAVRVGITKADFFEEKRKELPDSVFQSEYGSIFLGEEENSIFPYELTSSVRKLKRVEYSMPRGSKSYYIMSVDIATSSAKGSDNAVICVLKCTDKEDGTIMKQLVYIRSYNGRRLDELAEEVRRTYVRFPNTKKIIFDHRGLGDSFPAFFDTPWVDPDTDHEYPAWGLDDQTLHHTVPMLHSFKANMQLNQELVSALRVSLEQKTLMIPIDSRIVESEIEEGNSGIRKEERAIYIEADALQVEMGNLVMKVSAGTSNVTYDTAKRTQHKDRYSSLAMGVWYISKLEAENKKAITARSRGTPCIGIVSYF